MIHRGKLHILSSIVGIILCFSVVMLGVPVFASQSIKAGEKSPYDGRVFTKEETQQLLLKLDLLDKSLEENTLLKEKIKALEEKNKALEEQRDILLKQIQLYKESLLTTEQLQKKYEELWKIADKMLTKKEKQPSVAMQSGIYAALFVLGAFLGVQAAK